MQFAKRLLLALAFIALPYAPVFAQAIPSVDVPDNCTLEDNSDGSHTYPPSAQFLGICALAAASEQGAISSYELTNFSFGLFLSSLNGIAPSPDQFWSISKNSVEAQVGLSELALAQGDILSFQLIDFTNNSKIGVPISFRIGSLISSSQQVAPSAALSGLTLHDPFDVSRTISFIRRNQDGNGSFGSTLLNDWIAIASASFNADDIGKKLIEYEMNNPPTLSSVTDYERHSMALEALGIDPYSGTGIDYISPIINSFNGIQIGDTSLVNDDIFALFPLLHAGFAAEDEVISKTTAFIILKQQTDGSWANSVDLTAAAIQALKQVPSLQGTSLAVSKAVGYLRAQQKSDGGFGNASATSWVLQAIAALGQSVYDWSSGTYLTPNYYLATKQEGDGGIEPESADIQTRLWSTAYAVPAVVRKTWDSILQNFPKPIVAEESQTATSTTTPTTPYVVASTSPEKSAQEVFDEAPEESPTSQDVVPVTQVNIEEPSQPIDAEAENASTSTSNQNQVAAAATASGGFWNVILRAVTSFFSWLL